MNKNLLQDLNNLFDHLENSKNKKYPLIHKENMGFFKEAILSGRIYFQKKIQPSTKFVYMDVFDFTTDDIEILREYRDYLILIND